MRKRDLMKMVGTPWGRAVSASVGLGIVGFLLYHTGFQKILLTLYRSLSLFPAVLFLELGVLFCSMSALWLLYGEDRSKLPLGALIRAGLVGYSVMGLLPAGRPVADSTRAAML